mgnify:CR=1 FL=1
MQSRRQRAVKVNVPLSLFVQCTDLDGTLIEDQAEQNDWLRHKDDMTYQLSQHFAQFLAPAGGLIVYNTGTNQ